MWKHIAGSVQGASHKRSGEPCQDQNSASVLGGHSGSALVACVSDGAGSASHSQIGAQLACEAVTTAARERFEQRGDFHGVTREDALRWCAVARQQITNAAQESGQETRNYACTLSAALISELGSIFFQIGDGAMVARRGPAYGVVFWPQSGEYANSTNFLTQEGFQDNLEFLSLPHGFTDVALFTDGLERLALTFETQTAHSPFFDPLFGAVRQSEDLPTLNEQLAEFLTSEVVQSRSDDDKTLILATQSAG